MMIGTVAIVLSLFAGNYFRQSALNAQMSSLSRVIEVASQEMLKDVRGYTFDLGMKLGNSSELVNAVKNIEQPGGRENIIALLDDPFINGFVGFSKVNMVKLRIFDLNLKLLAESSMGMTGVESEIAAYISGIIKQRQGVERLKAIDGLWRSSYGPLYSMVVPVGGLRLTAYLEVVVDPVFNLPDIGKITKTPVSIFSIGGEQLNSNEQQDTSGFLPVEFGLLTSDGMPAFRIVGYENVDKLNQEMEKTKIVTTSGFLLLSMMTLLFALWLFNRFLFVPVSRMIQDMKQMACGDLDLEVNKTGLREFYTLAETFNLMADQVRMRTNDLRDSQNRLLQLLDLDDSAILYFGRDNDVIYFNKGTTDLFGYSYDEMSDMDSKDLFADDIECLMKNSVLQKLHVELHCVRNNGDNVKCNAVIHRLDVKGEHGFAVALNPMMNEQNELAEFSAVNRSGIRDQRMDVVEQSLNSILEIAKHNPNLVMGSSTMGMLAAQYSESDDEKSVLRNQCVNIMYTALACWEHDLGKNKLDLADESKIWQVYIDKSTPTTRTLDKYLNIESCPKNPRCQRVIDTAEFVLKKMGSRNTSGQKKLQVLLDELRLNISGMKASSSKAGI
ncbi:MAG: PAS domain S-box protein [Gammaproteobacteria bacterium]|nr:PAS domain S-box protein [Gammaproteobacteria bacterium]